MTQIVNMIVPVRDESQHELTAFLDQLSLQHNVDFNSFMVTVACLGNTSVSLREYPYRIDVKEFGTESMSAVFNTCIDYSPAEWVMFMECGDMMADIYSMSIMMNLLPTEEFDMIWMEYYREYLNKDGSIWVNIISDVDDRISGKLFRKSFLLEHNVRFDETMTRDEGTVFFYTCVTETDYSRFAKLTTRFVPYTNAAEKHAPGLSEYDMIKRQQELDFSIIRNVVKHTTENRYASAVMYAMSNAYYYTHSEHLTNDEHSKLIDNIRNLYEANRNIIDGMRDEDIEVFIDRAYQRMVAMIQTAHSVYGHEMYFDTESTDFRQWLNYLTLLTDEPATTKPVKEDKVAVFCGTRNVYECMETSAKTLMYHTQMDRIYFFIEDDTFPSQLPDNITCINVSNQTFFPKNGINYKNAWTYMCLMRAAFPKLLPDEHKILSLDIDVVVNEDISELWDIDLYDYYFAGVPETQRTKKNGATYCNFGVIMMNLDMLRNTGIDDKIIESLNRDRWGCPEQDAFNHFCVDKIYALDSMYNATRCGNICKKTDVEKISHYAGIKYWKHFKPFKKFSEMSWDDVLKGSDNHE